MFSLLQGNLGWALMQQNNYIEAEDAYRRALVIAPDNNKMCNLGICLMKQGRIGEAKDTLRRVKPAVADGPRGVDSHLKAYERAQQMLRDLESEMMNMVGDRVEQSKLFDAFLGSSAIWQPQPCKEHTALPPPPTTTDSSGIHPRDEFADENINSNVIIIPPPTQKKVLAAAPPPPPPPVQRSLRAIFNQANLNIDAPPFYSSKFATDPVGSTQQHPETLKRTRSGNAANFSRNRDMAESRITKMIEAENEVVKQSKISPENKDDSEDRWEDLLPDNKEFEEAIIAAVLGTGDDDEPSYEARKIDKRLKVFQDITISLSPRA